MTPHRSSLHSEQNLAALGDRRLGWAIALLLAVWICWNGWLLYPELSINDFPLNDLVLHQRIAERIAGARDAGENTLDFWMSEVSLGYPVPRSYHPLAHLLTAGSFLALGEKVELETVLHWIHYLSLVLFPLTVFLAARLLGLNREAAAGSALLSLTISTNGLYGLEFGSYVWRGSGLFSQSLAMHLLALSIGLGFRAIWKGRGLVLAAAALSLTFVGHLMFGYMAALSVVAMLLDGDKAVPRFLRATRLAAVATLATAFSAFHLFPLLRTAPFVNYSRWEAGWKWDSFGLFEVGRLLLTGELLDHDRAPVLTLLFLVGLATAAFTAFGRGPETPEKKETRRAHRFLLFGGLFWLLLFAGRPAWGPLLTLLGAIDGMHLHRFIGAIHLFAVFLGGLGLAAFWRRLVATGNSWPRLVAAAGLTAGLLFPVAAERAAFLMTNADWGRVNLAANRADRDLPKVLGRLQGQTDRVYAGLAAGWGSTFRTGSVPVYAHLALSGIPAVSFLYHSMSLASETMVLFDEKRADHYRLFNVSTVVAPAGQAVAGFLSQGERFGAYQEWRAPESGYFELVSVPYSVLCNRARLYEAASRWLESDWPAKRQHLGLDFAGAPVWVKPRLEPQGSWPQVEAAGDLGEILRESRQGEIYGADIRVDRESHLLFKMNFHPGWHAWLNGERVDPLMVAPAFQAIPVVPGRHRIEFRYEPGRVKAILLVLALLLLPVAFWVERRGTFLDREEQAAGFLRSMLSRVASAVRRDTPAATVFGLAVLCLPVCVPLMTSQLPSGHDAWEYVPRLIEFHENIRHGILFPQWAPDLSHGAGQPFFQFNPPLLYYLAEVPYLLGLEPAAALNATCIAIIITSGLGAFLLGSLYFGRAAGYLAACAYVYAPYFAVNLYVRHALAEFLAFAFYPLVLYCFGAYALRPSGARLSLAALSYAALLWTHNPAALIFTPLLVAFLVFNAARTRSWKRLLSQFSGFTVGLGIGAAGWLPSLLEKDYTQIDRLLAGELHYSNHFVYWRQLIWSSWGHGLSVPGASDLMDFSIGILLIAVALAGGWAARRTGQKHWGAWLFFGLALVALCAGTLTISKVVWDHFPLLQYLQFPWRILGVATVCMAVIASATTLLARTQAGWTTWTAGLVILLALAGAHRLRPASYLLVDSEYWTPEAIASRGIRVTTRAEYEPKWMQATPRAVRYPLRLTAGRADLVVEVQRSPTRWNAQVKAATDAEWEAFLAYFPGWEVSLNGQPIPLKISHISGLIRFTVPPGLHRIEIVYRPTWPRRVGWSITLFSLLVCGAGAVSRRRPQDEPAVHKRS